MCAIAGILDLQGQREIDPALLQRMGDAMVHRGPDGEGFFRDGGIGFAHRRLAIIDLAGGVQPFHARTKPGTLTFNGEIYNYRDLATRLTSDGVHLATRSDTETVAEGLSLYGPDWLLQMKGMFALGHWTPQTRTLLLARDRIGEKPLYYGQTADGYLIFASEIQGLLATGKFDPALDPHAVADYFYFGYVPDPKSIYRSIRKLPPGHFLTANPQSGVNIHQWWEPSYQPDSTKNYATSKDELAERLDQAVSSQMLADVPLGAFLSGGTDSAAIVSAMHRTGNRTGNRPITCTIGFDDHANDERPQARDIAKHFQTDHHEEIASLSTTSLIDDIARGFGEPFADSSALPTSIVSKLARRHVTVALSGDGADELFAGYRRYSFFLGEEKLRRGLPQSARSAIFKPLGAIYPKLDGFARPLRFKTTFQALGDTQADAYARATAIMLPDQMRALISKDFARTLDGYEPSDQITSLMNASNTDDPLARALYTDLKMWLAGRMLVKTDRASMMHSLEVRPPMLDPDLVQWAATLPASFKINKSGAKRILKDSIRDRLPAGYLDRPKSGFALPLSTWLGGTDNRIIARLQSSTHWKDSRMIDEQSVEKMIREQSSGQRDHAQALWSLIMFDAFLSAGHG